MTPKFVLTLIGSASAWLVFANWGWGRALELVRRVFP